MAQKELILEVRRLSDLNPAPYNPRTISPDALAGLRSSVERFGLVEPIVWNRRTGHVVGGHQRLKVLQALGETESQVVVVDLPEAEEKALNIALNNPAIAGEFTAELHTLLAEIEETLPDLSDALRFEDLADRTSLLLADLTPLSGNTPPDAAPEAPESPATNAGDIWVLGPHRLICGDSGGPGTLQRLMGSNIATLYVTDPPYGVGYDGSDSRKGADEVEAWDHFPDSKTFENFLGGVFQNSLPYLTSDAAWYCWHASATSDVFRRVWQTVGIRYHQTITWVKPTHVLGFAMWNYRSEPCLMGWQQGHKPAAYLVPGERSNVWEVDWEGKARCTDGVHPTQKPVRLFELPMLKHTRPGEICLETFCGSGSQIIAAERLNRRCFAIERNPRFVDVAVHRWEAYTGQQAERLAGAEVR